MKEKWTVSTECLIRREQQNSFTKVWWTTVCLICQETVAVFKEHSISRYVARKHANYASKQSTQERAATPQRLAANSQTQHDSRVEYQGKFFTGIFSKASFWKRLWLAVELIDKDVASELNRKAESYKFCSPALYESYNIKYTSPLLIFVRGINNSFEIKEEF